MTVDGLYNESFLEDILTDGSNLSGSSYHNHTSIREDQDRSYHHHPSSREDNKYKQQQHASFLGFQMEREDNRNRNQHHTSNREENRNTNQYLPNTKQDSENRNRNLQYGMNLNQQNVSRGEESGRKNSYQLHEKKSELHKKKSGLTGRPRIISSDEDVCYSNILMNEAYKNILMNESELRTSSRIERGEKCKNSPRRQGNNSRQRLVSSSDEEIDYNILSSESSNLGEKAKRFVYTKDSWDGGMYATPARKQRTPLPGFETPRYVEDLPSPPNFGSVLRKNAKDLPRPPSFGSPQWERDVHQISPQTTATYDSSEFSSDSAESSTESPTNMVRMLSYRKL